MVDFSDITMADIEALYNQICEVAKENREAFIKDNPIWAGFEFKPPFGDLDGYKQHLLDTIQEYQQKELLLFDDYHDYMQSLHNKLKQASSLDQPAKERNTDNATDFFSRVSDNGD